MLSRRESLTAGEDRVAMLAAQGLTNREIAQRQFETMKAVESHLRNIFRKLDVASRDELPAALDHVCTSDRVGQAGRITGSGAMR
jgi:DNA-binding CsgD family transcriptional regulator